MPPYTPTDMKYGLGTDQDVELNALPSIKMEGLGSFSTVDGGGPDDHRRRSLRAPFHHWVDGFRRFAPADDAAEQAASAPPPLATGGGGPGAQQARAGFGGRRYDLHAAASSTANTALSRDLKGRHLQMIAIGGSIGTGLFVASGMSLALGGPASVLLAYAFIGVNLYCTVQALGEMAVAFPVAGSFSVFSTRFLDPSWGFAMGWK